LESRKIQILKLGKKVLLLFSIYNFRVKAIERAKTNFRILNNLKKIKKANLKN